MRKFYFYLFVFLFSGLLTPALGQEKPKNIIIVLANGAGHNHFKAAGYYLDDTTQFDNFTLHSSTNTHPAINAPLGQTKELKDFNSYYESRKAWNDITYVSASSADFASSGTAIATGMRTAPKALSMGIDSMQLTSFFDKAFSNGKSTGIITSGPITKSASAAFASNRLTVDSTRLIAQDILTGTLQFVSSCGNPHFDNNGQENPEGDFTYWGKKDIWESLTSQATAYGDKDIADIDNDGEKDIWELATSLDEISETNKRVFFSPKVFKNLNQARSGDVQTIGERNANIPSLGAIAVAGLNNLSSNDEGMVLVVESNSIADASFANQKGRMIEEMIDLFATIDSIKTWVEANSNWDETLLIVNGTFDAGFVTGPELGDTTNAVAYYEYLAEVEANPETTATPVRPTVNKILDYYPISSKGKDNIPDFKFASTTASNMLTPFYAKGKGASMFNAYQDQTDYIHRRYINNTSIGLACLEFLDNDTPKQPKNIILMISDGCGHNHMKAAEFYQGKESIARTFPVQLYLTSYPGATNEASGSSHLQNFYSSYELWKDSAYYHNAYNRTCSAASGTAFATGSKSYYYGMGLDLDKNALSTISRNAKAIDKSIGIVTTVRLNDATPASFLAHNISRINDKEILLEMLIEGQADVLIGCANPFFNSNGEERESADYGYVAGKSMWDALSAGETEMPSSTKAGFNTLQDIDGDGDADAWEIASSIEDFNKIINGEAPKRLLGLPKVSGALQAKRDGDKMMVNFDNQIKTVPNLGQLSLAGLEVLNQNSTGFFALIEGASVDDVAHDGQIGRVIEEEIDFLNAVDSVVAWIEKNGGWEENLLIVTADHETGGLTGPNLSNNDIIGTYEVVDKGAGKIPGFEFNTHHHSNALVPFFAKGTGSEEFLKYAEEFDYVWGPYINNSEVGIAMQKLWDLEPVTIQNYRPQIVSNIEKAMVTVGEDFSLELPLDILDDKEDVNFLIDATTLPDWATYNQETRTISGNPTKAENAWIKVVYFDGESTGAAVAVKIQFRIESVEQTTDIEKTRTNIQCFPNPATIAINISLEKESKVVISDLTGKTVYQAEKAQGTLEVPCKGWAAGLYKVTIIDDTQQKSTKVLIK